MSRRRTAKPRLSPVWMPYLRDKLADWLDDRHDVEYGRPSSAYSDMLQAAWSQGDSLRHSPMWWVSRDMTTLAVHTALHEDPPEVNPPSATGFILFDGGLDLTGAPDAPLAHIVGLRWAVETSTDGADHVGMEMFSDDPGVCELMRCPLPLVPMPRSVAVDASFAREANVFERVLRAVWALSAEPTVCAVDRPDRPDGLEPLPSRMVDNAVRDVRMVILRENVHSPSGEGTGGGPRREYSHRFIVRGFWRNQAYGKNHELRRRQWIPPFVKGPADKPLIAKDTVRIWRR